MWIKGFRKGRACGGTRSRFVGSPLQDGLIRFRLHTGRDTGQGKAAPRGPSWTHRDDSQSLQRLDLYRERC